MNCFVLVLVTLVYVMYNGNIRNVIDPSTCEDKNSTLYFGYDPLNETVCESQPSWRYDVINQHVSDRFVALAQPVRSRLGRAPHVFGFPAYPEYVNYKVCLEIHFADGPVLIDKIKVRGTSVGVVSLFILLLQDDQGEWQVIQEVDSEQSHIFERGDSECGANTSMAEVLFMPRPVRTSGLRVYPQASVGKPMMQIDVHSCKSKG